MSPARRNPRQRGRRLGPRAATGATIFSMFCSFPVRAVASVPRRAADDLGAGGASRSLVLSKPAAGCSDRAMRQGLRTFGNAEFDQRVVDQPAAPCALPPDPLHAAMLHAGAGKPHSVLDWDTAPGETVEHLLGRWDRRIDIRNLPLTSYDAEQGRAGFRRCARTGCRVSVRPPVVRAHCGARGPLPPVDRSESSGRPQPPPRLSGSTCRRKSG
jgi:hypothetical protein